MSDSPIKNTLEAALLASGRSLTLNELAQLFEESARPDAPALRSALAELAEQYAQHAVEVKETGAGFRIQVRREYSQAVARLWPERPQRYSRALLETLALIAYRQPITRAEIESVRGVAVNPNIIKTLLERQWIKVVGHRDLPGRPELLGTTREFLEYFGLKRLQELPPLEDLRTLGEIDPQLDLRVAGAIGPEASAEVPLTAAALPSADSDEAEESLNDAEPSDEEEFSAAPEAKSGLVAAATDDDA